LAGRREGERCGQAGLERVKVLSGEFVSVAVDVSVGSSDGCFDYRMPKEMRERARVGARVLVPFGGRRVEGYITGFKDRTAVAPVKDVEALLEERPVVTPSLLELARWMADRYCCRLIDCLRSLVPAGTRRRLQKRVRLAPDLKPGLERILGELKAGAPKQYEVMALLARNREVTANTLKQKAGLANPGPVLQALVKKGYITVEQGFTTPVGPRQRRVVCLAVDAGAVTKELSFLETRAPKQAAVLRFLLETRGLDYTQEEIARLVQTSSSTVRVLARKGLVRLENRVEERDPLRDIDAHGRSTKPPVPTQDQRNVLELIRKKILARETATVLLHGVTGSGKTEVYLSAVELVLEQGRQAIVLVPEIALTPQTIRRFVERFGRQVAVLHSGLSPGERYDEWCKIRSGRVKVVVGARSAVFAPFDNLGLIVIDEEHENTYKQETTPRYQTQEVALKRAALENGLVLLGSATPSVETYYRALKGDYLLGTLPRRINSRPLPEVEVVDMREELRRGNRSIFSRRLQNEIGHCLNNGEQAILFLNRRGYTTFVLCRECGQALRCHRCDVSLTYHRQSLSLHCHYCGASRPVPETCPKCGSRYIRHFGAGTQRVVEEVKRRWPSARVLRMDVDSTAAKGSHRQILEQFEKGRADILVGTQMVAKGLDIGGVTLVGVVAADTTLHLPHFRAGERTFQLLTQVAGRAGRGPGGGKVIIQTYNPDHYAVAAAREHDYESFYRTEIEIRRELGYPPFGHLARFVISGRDQAGVRRLAQALGAALEDAGRDGAVEIYGPGPAPLSRLKGRYRWHLVLKGPREDELRHLVLAGVGSLQAQGGGPGPGEVTYYIDFAPTSLL